MFQTYTAKNVIEEINLGYWELHDNTSYWSSAFIKRLGYSCNDISISLSYFLDHLIHPDHKNLFQDHFFNLVDNKVHFQQHILIKEASGTYSEFICKTDVDIPITKRDHSSHIFFFKSKLTTHDKVKGAPFYYDETAQMTSTGSWYIDFEKRKTYWDRITREILEFPEDFIPSLKMFEQLYTPKYHQQLTDAFYRCALNGKPFEHIIMMYTASKRKFWAKVKGKPVFSQEKEIIGIRGVIQDIDDLKRKEISLKKTSKIIESQNSRLFNFAHIVSHNLRSHSSNLTLIVELLNDLEDPSEKMDLLDHITDVSESLNSTIEHLNEVVSIHTRSYNSLETVRFQDTLDQVCKSIGHVIETGNVVITSDFSGAETIKYIPAYLDSIILNLLTNSIKYKHPERHPIVYLKSYIDPHDDGIVLEVSDNGLGNDLEKFGDKLFGMYNTFHYNSDAVGIGLFITKNQIESLNGHIHVESEVNHGTKFIIKF